MYIQLLHMSLEENVAIKNQSFSVLSQTLNYLAFHLGNEVFRITYTVYSG